MQRHRYLLLATGLFFSHVGVAQVKTHYWAEKESVEVTIDKRTGYAYVPGNDSPLIPTGNISVKPGPGIDIHTLIESSSEDLAIVQIGRHGTFLLKPRSGQDVFDVANQLYESGQAQWAFPEFNITISAFQNDPLYTSQYYLHNTGQNGGTAGMDINAPGAWLITRGVNKVKVAVIDSGVAPHEDLTEISPSDSRVLPGYDPTDPGNPGLPTNTDIRTQIHGESVAGIIGASHNSLGIAGVAPCSNILPVNIFSLTSITTTQLAEAIDWAWDLGQADVLNNSWGYETCGPTQNFPDINQAILNARTLGRNGKGCPVVFSSGNASCRVSYPANLPGVITVGALTKNGQLAPYSNSGPETDLVAFGGYVSSFSGHDIVTTDLMGPDGINTAPDGHYYGSFGGTSAACPQVAGTLALMLSANPDLTEAQLSQILRTTATDMGPAGFDNSFGYGRLNAEAALQAALPIITGPAGVSDKGSATYSVPQQAGTTVSWQAEPADLFLNAQATGATASFTAGPYPSDLGQQCGTLTATISGPCGSLSLSKPILIYPGATDFRGQVPPCPAGGGGGNPSSRPAYDVAAYPNPVNTSLRVELRETAAATRSLTASPAEYQLALYDAYGTLRRSVKTQRPTLNLEVADLPEGSYFLRTTLQGSTSVKQLMIKH